MATGYSYKELYQKPTDGIPVSDIDTQSGNLNKCLMVGSSGVTYNFPVTITTDGDNLSTISVRTGNGLQTANVGKHYMTHLVYRSTASGTVVVDMWIHSQEVIATNYSSILSTAIETLKTWLATKTNAITRTVTGVVTINGTASYIQSLQTISDTLTVNVSLSPGTAVAGATITNDALYNTIALYQSEEV